MIHALRKKNFLATVAAASLLSAPVFAYDGYNGYEGSGPSYARSGGGYNWSGPYIGGHGGYSWGNFRSEDGTPGPDGSYGSWMGGAQIGHNWQHRHIVWGVEGDASILNTETRSPTSYFQEDWMATMRARLGFDMHGVLPYGTAGLALTDVISKAPGLGSKSRIQPGLALGGGIDFPITKKMNWVENWLGNDWFGRVEYLYVAVPKDNANLNGTTVSGGSNNNIVRFALNYKF